MLAAQRLEGRLALTTTPHPVLEVDSALSGTISLRNEVDRYGIGVAADEIFSIMVTSTDPIYPWVRVVDASGRELSGINEAGAHRFVTTAIRAPRDAVFVEAFTYGGYRTGDYQLDLWIQDEPARLLDAVLILTNHERLSQGLPPLGRDSRLDSAAQRHTDDMVVNNFFSHGGSNGSSAGERVTQAGFPWQAVGENIAQGQRDAATVVDGWMNSPGHRANILNSAFKEIGVGYGFSNSSGRLYWTQVFGTETNSVVDTARPTFSSATMSADGSQIILSYNEPLSFMTAAASAFRVTVDGAVEVVSSATVSGSSVILTLASSTESGQSVTVAYTAPSAGDQIHAIQDITGNDALSVSATSVATPGPSLTTGTAGHLFVGGHSVTKGGRAVTASFYPWTIFEAAIIQGQRLLFAQHVSGRVHRLLANADWSLKDMLHGVATGAPVDLPRSARGAHFPVTQDPVPFPPDLRIALENAGTALRVDPQGLLYADGTRLLASGSSSGISRQALAGFSPLAVARTNTDAAWRNTVLWQHRTNQTLVEWQFDANWTYRGTSRVAAESLAALELAYQIDIDRDSHIG